MIFITTYRVKPYLTREETKDLMAVFAAEGPGDGATAHYVATDGSHGVVISDVDDAAESYRNILSYTQWVQYESSVMLTIDDAVPQILDALAVSHVQLSRTKIVPERWQGLSDEENDAQTAAIYEVIGRHGGDVMVVAFSPTEVNLVSVIEYPDEMSAKRSVAGVLALGTLDYVSVEVLWDVVEWVGIVRAASAG